MALTDHLRDVSAKVLRSIPFKGRWRVGHVLNRLFGPLNPVVPEIFLPEVGRVRLDLRDRDMLAQCYWVGLSKTDRGVIGLLTRVLDIGSVFVDVGANVGIYTLAVARHLSRGGGRVICFEPHPVNFARLREHIVLNGLDNITAEELGVSDAPGQLEVAGSEHPGNWTLLSQGPLRFTIALTTLDDYFAKHPVERLDAIKLDIEGVEPKAIQGARRTIERFRPVITFEINPHLLQRMGSGVDELLDLIEGLGYRIFEQSLRRPTMLSEAQNRSDLRNEKNMKNLIAFPNEWCSGQDRSQVLHVENLQRS
jgi:FkbM family methyltransferase